MSDPKRAPERIWRRAGHWPYPGSLDTPYVKTTFSEMNDFAAHEERRVTEYVRADLYDAQREEMERLRAEVADLKAKLEWADSAVREVKRAQADNARSQQIIESVLMREKPSQSIFANPAQEGDDA